jgi:phosphatidylinositol alpha-mannosyltransferase
MAGGCPVVASNIRGFAGVITHGMDGLLVPPKDFNALADAMLELIDDEPRRRSMAQLASQRAQEFSWDRVSRRVLAYYERLAYEKGLAHQDVTEVAGA